MVQTKGQGALGPALKSAGKTQKWLAELLSVRQPQISRWCAGDARPGATERVALRELLGIPEADWLTDEERALVKRAKGMGSKYAPGNKRRQRAARSASTKPARSAA